MMLVPAGPTGRAAVSADGMHSRVTRPRSSRSRAGRNSFGKSTWSVRKMFFVRSLASFSGFAAGSVVGEATEEIRCVMRCLVVGRLCSAIETRYFGVLFAPHVASVS